jgi:lysophospholipase L1-like esterase
MTGVQYPPQIQGLPAQSDLVTVTAGGNDLKFAASMLYEAWSHIQPTSPIVTMMAHEFPHGIPEPTPATIEAMAQGLVDIVREVRVRAADARVILVDYLTVLAESTATSDEWPLSAEQTASFRRIEDGIGQGYQIAADITGVEVLRAK